MIKQIFFFAFITASLQSFSQLDWKNIQIREAFESPEDHKEAATISYTNPTKGQSSFLINAGIAYDWVLNKEKKKFSISPFFVLNKNNMIDKEQDNYKGGFVFNKKIGTVDANQGKSFFTTWRTTGEFVKNQSDTTNNFFITSYFFVNYSRVDTTTNTPYQHKIYINAYRHFGKGFFYFIGFTAGTEIQYRAKAPKEINEGGIVRGYYDVGLSILKKTGNDDTGDPIAEIAFSNKGRYDLINSTSEKEGYLHLIKVELLVYPTGTRSLSLGFSYNNGSDPIAGIEEQEYYLLALKVKI